MIATAPASRFRVHRSTIVVGLLLLTLCLILMVPGLYWHPGNSKVSFAGRFQGNVTARRHGWPLFYLERAVYEQSDVLLSEPLYTVPWLSWNAWTDWRAEDYYKFSPLNFCFDLLVLLAIVFVPAGLWESRRRRRKKLLQFKLSELAILFTGISIALGWLTYQRNEYYREQAHFKVLENSKDENGFYGLRDYGFWVIDFDDVPGWIPRLIGEEIIPDYSSRVTHLAYVFPDLSSDEPPLLFADVFPHIQAFNKLTWLSIYLPADRTANLYSLMAELPQLRILEFGPHIILNPLNEAEAKELTTAQQITKLIFCFRNDVTPAAKKILRERMPNCTISYAEDELLTE